MTMYSVDKLTWSACGSDLNVAIGDDGDPNNTYHLHVMLQYPLNDDGLPEERWNWHLLYHGHVDGRLHQTELATGDAESLAHAVNAVLYNAIVQGLTTYRRANVLRFGRNHDKVA